MWMIADNPTSIYVLYSELSRFAPILSYLPLVAIILLLSYSYPLSLKFSFILHVVHFFLVEFHETEEFLRFSCCRCLFLLCLVCCFCFRCFFYISFPPSQVFLLAFAFVFVSCAVSVFYGDTLARYVNFFSFSFSSSSSTNIIY